MASAKKGVNLKRAQAKLERAQRVMLAQRPAQKRAIGQAAAKMLFKWTPPSTGSGRSPAVAIRNLRGRIAADVGGSPIFIRVRARKGTHSPAQLMRDQSRLVRKGNHYRREWWGEPRAVQGSEVNKLVRFVQGSAGDLMSAWLPFAQMVGARAPQVLRSKKQQGSAREKKSKTGFVLVAKNRAPHAEALHVGRLVKHSQKAVDRMAKLQERRLKKELRKV